MPGPRVLGGVLGRLADQPRERDKAAAERTKSAVSLRSVTWWTTMTTGPSARPARRMRLVMVSDYPTHERADVLHFACTT